MASVVGHPVARSLGLVYGNTIRARHFGKDILAGLKNLVGGEIEEYRKLMAEAGTGHRSHGGPGGPARRQRDHHVRFGTSCIMGSASEIPPHGEAVVVEKL